MNRFMTNLRSLPISEKSRPSAPTHQYSLSLPTFQRPVSSSFLGNIGEPLEDGQEIHGDIEDGAELSADPDVEPREALEVKAV